MVLGVSQWLSRKFKVDVTLIRAGFLIAVIVYGTGLAAYLILWLVKEFIDVN